MRSFGLYSLFLVALNVAVVAAQSVPLCGLSCIVSNTQNSTCELTNVTCICTNTELNAAISLCVKAECTIHEQLQVKNYSMTSCGVKPRDRSVMSCTISVTFSIIGILAFIIRVVSRFVVGIRTSWGPDDWVMIAVMVLAIPFGFLSIPLKDNGLGRDVWTLTPKQITTLLHIYFFDELIYLGVLPLIKISILLFYRRIFVRKPIRVTIWVLIGCNICYLIAFEVVSIWQCDPLRGAWMSWDGTVDAKCRNINAQSWAAASFNIVLDLVMLILPLPELYSLNLSLRKKAQVLLMFSLGFFVTVVSVIRLSSLATYGTHSENTTQDYTEIGYWSTIEVPVGIVCACLPAFRSLLGHLCPNAFSTTRNKSDYLRSNEAEGTFPKGASSKGGSASRKSKIRVREEWSVSSSYPGQGASDVELSDVHASMDGHSMSTSTKEPARPRESV